MAGRHARTTGELETSRRALLALAAALPGVGARVQPVSTSARIVIMGTGAATSTF